MTEGRRILVVAGARALDVSPAARLWAMRELAVTLRCDWRRTNGTGRARDYLAAQLGADRVSDLVCPPEYGPGGDR